MGKSPYPSKWRILEETGGEKTPFFVENRIFHYVQNLTDFL